MNEDVTIWSMTDLYSWFRKYLNKFLNPPENLDFNTWWQQEKEEFYFALSLKLWRYNFKNFQSHYSGTEIKLQDLIQNLCKDSASQNFWLSTYLALLIKIDLSALSNWEDNSACQSVWLQLSSSLGTCQKWLPAVTDFTATFMVLSFNRLAKLKNALNCIFNQTISNWKLIIVDGGSSDGSVEYCQELANIDPRIHFIHRPDLPRGQQGIIRTMEILIQESQTELIVFCPDDDWFSPNYLEILTPLYRQYPHAGMALPTYKIYDAKGIYSGSDFGPFLPEAGLIDPKIELQRAAVIGLCGQGGLYRREVLMEKGLDLLKPRQDSPPSLMGWDYVINMFVYANYQVSHSPTPVFNITVDDTTAVSGGTNSCFGLIIRILLLTTN